MDLNKLREAVQAKEVGENINEFIMKEDGSPLSERIEMLEAKIAAGMSDEELQNFERENDTTPQKMLEKLVMLQTLRSKN